MSLVSLKNELAIRSKNGIAFLIAGTIVWMIITIIFLQDFALNTKNIFMLYSTGIMFPTAIVVSKVIKAEWKSNDHPLSSLGLSLNLAQLMYFPLLFWAFAKSPEQMVLFFAIITVAHFFPYGWLYHTKSYYILSPIFSILILIIGWSTYAENLWLIPISMVAFLSLLVGLLFVDFRRKKLLLSVNRRENHRVK